MRTPKIDKATKPFFIILISRKQQNNICPHGRYRGLRQTTEIFLQIYKVSDKAMQFKAILLYALGLRFAHVCEENASKMGAEREQNASKTRAKREQNVR